MNWANKLNWTVCEFKSNWVKLKNKGSYWSGVKFRAKPFLIDLSWTELNSIQLISSPNCPYYKVHAWLKKHDFGKQLVSKLNDLVAWWPEREDYSKKLEEIDDESVWGLCVKSLFDDVIVKWRVPMEVIGNTSSEVSPFSTCRADRETYQILCKQSKSVMSIQED